MALPSGSVSRPFNCVLQVVFSGEFWDNSSTSYWAPDGVDTLYLRGIVEIGSEVRTVVLGYQNTSGVIEIDYVAGQTVDVSMELISQSIGGIGSIGARRLRIRCYFIKR